MTIGYGTLYYSFSVLAPEIAREFRWGQSFVFGVFSFGLLAGAIAAPILAVWSIASGRLILCVGSIAASLALALFAVMQNAWQFAVITLAADSSRWLSSMTRDLPHLPRPMAATHAHISPW